MKKVDKISKSEEIISMFIGLVIVVALVWLVFNIISSKKGSVDLPGVSNQISLDDDSDIKNDGETKNVDQATYVVKKGDYLSKIAKEKLGSGKKWIEIATLNNLKNPDMLVVGQEIKLPGTEAVGNNQLNEYKVARGDSLWKIAVKTYGDGFRWTEIWNLNRSNLRNPGLLEIGMVLQLPASK